MKRTLLAILFAIGLQSTAIGGMEEGKAFFDAGKYSEALKEWKPLAEQGNADAQANLGVMYALGRGVPLDYWQANVWFRKAAEQGHAVGLHNLGAHYASGQGVPKDPVIAYMLCTLAAAQQSSLKSSCEKFTEKLAPQQIQEGRDLASRWKPGNPLPTKSRTGARIE